MTQNIFGLLFIAGSCALLIGVDYLWGLENLTASSFIAVMIAYFLGRYSKTLPEDNV